jgi:hypothetical protein
VSRASTGYGAQLQYSLDGIGYTAIAQLQKFAPGGSKLNLIDQTNTRSRGHFTRPYAAQVDAGEIDFAGVYSGDPTQLVLGRFHGARTLVQFRVLFALSDGSATWYSFQAYVSEFKPFDVLYNKFIPFSGKFRLVGGLESPLSGFQPNGFGDGFQTVQI